MAQVPSDIKRWLFVIGPKWHARFALLFEVLGLVCLVIGIAAAGTNSAVGLGATNWILVAIGLWVWGLWAWLAAYLAAKEG